jgi:nitroimidazol reductase NimA-like FMN-containing flavoprotein (pyridoxamine 5'-phosphate oxidase superfamily)
VSDDHSDSRQRLAELDRDECIRLLGSTKLGRLAVLPPTWSGAPVIRPVSYAFDPSSQSIVFRSAQGSKFTALLLSKAAAFEIDGLEPTGDSGWSVIVQGPIEEIDSPTEIRRLERLGLRTPVAAEEKTHWMRIRATAVTGRRIAL